MGKQQQSHTRGYSRAPSTASWGTSRESSPGQELPAQEGQGTEDTFGKTWGSPAPALGSSSEVPKERCHNHGNLARAGLDAGPVPPSGSGAQERQFLEASLLLLSGGATFCFPKEGFSLPR